MSEQENSDILERYYQEFFEAPEWRTDPDESRLHALRCERTNPQRITSLVLIFSDVVLAVAVWGVAIMIRDSR
jgi:hypothetical protein